MTIVSPLIGALATDVESRDDEDDWNMEGLNKPDMIARLRSLPSQADCRVVVRFFDREASTQAHCESVDLTPGVVAIVLANGSISGLEFDLAYPAVQRRLVAAGISGTTSTDCNVNFDGKQEVASSIRRESEPPPTANLQTLDKSLTVDDEPKSLAHQVHGTADDVDMDVRKKINLGDFIVDLADQVEALDDEDDWEDEGLDKAGTVAKLRVLPKEATLSVDTDKACLHFSDVPRDAQYEAVDLLPGVSAHVVQPGDIVALEFALNCPRAVKKLNEVVTLDH